MEPSRVIEILQDGKSRGSGYLITPRHVLTARHVSRPAEVGAVCDLHPLRGGDETMASPQEPRPPPVPAKVGWVSAEHDFALIEVTGVPLCAPETGSIPFGEVPADGIARQIIGSGFPEAAGADQRTIIGTLTWVLTAPGRFDIDVISAIPRDWTKWAGFSGAAVFADNILVGVMRTVDGNWNGGVLEATPAIWLLSDRSPDGITFEAYLKSACLPLPNCLDVGAVDRIMPLDFEADVSTQGPLRFSPRNPRVPFLGREAALRALDEFLTAKGRHPFSWWVIIGGGGAGKTRLAREICLRMRRRGWRAGFLPSSFVANTSSLDAWCPRTPTLIVADYVLKRTEEIRKLAARLARRDGLPPLRLLLLEREAGTLFENQFLGNDYSDRGVIEQARYQPEPLSLSELTEDEIWALVKACPWRPDAACVPLTRNEFFRRLDKLDSQHRPLVAMILADALATSAAGTALDELEEVLRFQLNRDRQNLWPKELGVANTPVGTTDADVAIAFATMMGGLGWSELEAIKEARGKPVDPGILKWCAIAIGKPLGSVPRLGRLEPDLIGEFFALETLRGDPDDPFADANSWMPKAAWRANGSEMFDFVARTKQTFSSHAAIQKVAITVEGVRESWLLAALTILAGANNLAQGIDAAQKWLYPRAESDAAAALAFADLSFRVAAASLATGIVPPHVLTAFSEFLGDLDNAHSNEPALREAAASARVNIGVALRALGSNLAAIVIFDDIVESFGAANEPAVREAVARALVNKGGALGALDRSEEAIAVCDEIVMCFGVAGEERLREAVARALINKGGALVALGRSEEAIAVYDDVSTRFGAAGEPELREQVAMAMFNTGQVLAALGRSEEAIASYDEIVKRFGAAGELKLREVVATALLNKGVTFGALGRSEQAITACNDLVNRFGATNEPTLRAQVAKALVNKGIELGTHGSSETAIAVCDDVVERFGAAGEPELHEAIATALYNKAVALVAVGRSEEAIATTDDMVMRFGAASEPALRKQVADALVNKAGVLVALGRSGEAVAICDDVIARFGAAGEPALREVVAKALLNKGVALGALGRGDDAIVACDGVVDRFGAADEPAFRLAVVTAHVNKAVALDALGRSEEAIAVCDDVLERFGATGEPALREQTAKALVNKGIALAALDRNEVAITVFDNAVERFGATGEPAFDETVAKALVNKGASLGKLGRSEEAIAACDDVIAHFGAAGNVSLREQVAIALFNKVVALFALGRSGGAIAVYDEIVDRFGGAIEPALRQTVAKALVNKGGALIALGSPEEAIATVDDLVARFGAAGEIELRKQVATALIKKVMLLLAFSRYEEAIAVCDDIVERFGAVDEPAWREAVAWALGNKVGALNGLGRNDEAILTADDMVARFGAAGEPALSEQVATALLNKVLALDALGRSEESIAVYDGFVKRFGGASEPALRQIVPEADALGNSLIPVGTLISERPPDSSEQAQFGHSAPTLGV